MSSRSWALDPRVRGRLPKEMTCRLHESSDYMIFWDVEGCSTWSADQCGVFRFCLSFFLSGTVEVEDETGFGIWSFWQETAICRFHMFHVSRVSPEQPAPQWHLALASVGFPRNQPGSSLSKQRCHNLLEDCYYHQTAPSRYVNVQIIPQRFVALIHGFFLGEIGICYSTIPNSDGLTRVICGRYMLNGSMGYAYS